jgi:hypothetical protein
LASKVIFKRPSRSARKTWRESVEKRHHGVDGPRKAHMQRREDAKQMPLGRLTMPFARPGAPLPAAVAHGREGPYIRNIRQYLPCRIAFAAWS